MLAEPCLACFSSVFANYTNQNKGLDASSNSNLSFKNLGSLNEQAKLCLLYSDDNEFFEVMSSLNLNQIGQINSELKEEILKRICTVCVKGIFIHQSIQFLKSVLICSKNKIKLNQSMIRNIKEVLEYLIQNSYQPQNENNEDDYMDNKSNISSNLRRNYDSGGRNFSDQCPSSSSNLFPISEEDLIDISLLLSFLSK